MLRNLLVGCSAAALAAWPVTAQPVMVLPYGISVLAPKLSSAVAAADYLPLGAAFQEDIAVAGGGSAGAALGVTNTKNITLGCWEWTPHLQSANNNRSRGWPVPLCLRSNGNGICEASTGPAVVCNALDSASAVSFIQLNYPDGLGSGSSHTVDIAGNGSGKTTFTSGCWNFFLVSLALGSTGHSAIFRGACGATPVDVGSLHGTGDFNQNVLQNITPDLNNATGLTAGQPGMGWANTNQTDFAFGWQSVTFVAEEAMVCTAAGVPYADCPSADTFAPSVLARFGAVNSLGNWGPKDPGTDCHVYSPTSRQPEICLYPVGNDPDTMIPNHGTADSGTGNPATAFTKIQIKPGASMWAPPYGPGGIPPHQATLKWLQHYTPGASITSATLAITPSSGGFALTISVGDLLIAGGALTDASGTTDHAMTCPATWNTVGPAQEQTQHHMNAVVCWKIATSSDLTAPAITWTTTNTRDSAFFLLDYANVASVDFGAIAATTASQATGPTPSGHTTAQANETIVSGLFSFSTNKIYTPPATGMTRWRYPNTSTAIQSAIHDKNATTEGAAIPAGTNTQVSWGLSANDSSIGWTLALIPN